MVAPICSWVLLPFIYLNLSAILVPSGRFSCRSQVSYHYFVLFYFTKRTRATRLVKRKVPNFFLILGIGRLVTTEYRVLPSIRYSAEPSNRTEYRFSPTNSLVGTVTTCHTVRHNVFPLPGIGIGCL